MKFLITLEVEGGFLRGLIKDGEIDEALLVALNDILEEHPIAIVEKVELL